MARGPLNAFPKPLLDELVDGRWLPVIGAGMSLNAILPPGKKIPLWDDLGRSLASEMREYDYTGVLDAISAYCQQFSRAKLVERISELLLVDSAKPGDPHRAFCSIKFSVVCTTNFDFLLEKQYDSNPRYCRPVMYEDQLSLPNREPGVLLLKLHGDVHHPDRLVATEEDYDGFLRRFPLVATYLANLLITKTAVFVGYSLDDPDFRQVFQLISGRLGRLRRPAYAIRVGATPQEVARFERRGVKVINLKGSKSKYAQILTAIFAQLHDYQESTVISASEVTDEAALGELKLPSGAVTRLCYFAVPFTLSALYKEFLFPIAQQYGFVPITAETVVSPGDSVAAKIDAVLAKTNVAIVDASSDWTQFELRIALSKLGGDRVLVITDQAGALATDLSGVRALVRPGPSFTDAEPFLHRVADWFAERAEAIRPTLDVEPERLLQIGSARAAVIAAMTLLEVQLRKSLALDAKSESRPMSLGQLARLASTVQLIGPEAAERIRAWLRIRNVAVHTANPISLREARGVIDGVRDLIRRLTD
jgi:SIR2-like domain